MEAEPRARIQRRTANFPSASPCLASAPSQALSGQCLDVPTGAIPAFRWLLFPRARPEVQGTLAGPLAAVTEETFISPRTSAIVTQPCTTLPGQKSADTRALQDAPDAYVAVQTDPTGGQSGATTDCALLDAKVKEVAGLRRQIQCADESVRVHRHRHQQLGYRGGGTHEPGQSRLVAGRNQHPHPRLVLFQRSPVKEASRPFLPPAVAMNRGASKKATSYQTKSAEVKNPCW